MDYFEYAKKYRNYNPNIYGRWQREYARMLDRVLGLRGKTVLDIGCAAGAHVKAFNDVCGADAFGCDVNQGVIERTPFKRKRHRLRVVETDKLALYYGPEMFDVVVSQQVFEHFPDREYSIRVIHEIHTILRPGGIAYIALVAGEHRTKEDVESDPTEDSTHINIWPMEWWHSQFRFAGFDNADAVYQPLFENEPMYRRYRWQQMIWAKRSRT